MCVCVCVCVCVCTDVPQAVIAAGDDERTVSVEVNLKNKDGIRGQRRISIRLIKCLKSKLFHGHMALMQGPGQRSEVRTYSRDGVRVSWQSLQTFSCLNIPDTNTLIKLETHRHTQASFNEKMFVCTQSECLCWGSAAYRSRHHQVRLRVEVTAENVVTVTLQSLQTLPLQRQTDRHSWCIPVGLRSRNFRVPCRMHH